MEEVPTLEETTTEEVSLGDGHLPRDYHLTSEEYLHD